MLSPLLSATCSLASTLYQPSENPGILNCWKSALLCCLRCSVLLVEQMSSVLFQHPENWMQSLTGDWGWAVGLQMRGWSLLIVFCHSGWEGAVGW